MWFNELRLIDKLLFFMNWCCSFCKMLFDYLIPIVGCKAVDWCDANVWSSTVVLFFLSCLIICCYLMYCCCSWSTWPVYVSWWPKGPRFKCAMWQVGQLKITIYSSEKVFVTSRAVDLDPHLFPPWIWISIQYANLGGKNVQIKTEKMQGSWHYLHFILKI